MKQNEGYGLAIIEFQSGFASTSVLCFLVSPRFACIVSFGFFFFFFFHIFLDSELGLGNWDLGVSLVILGDRHQCRSSMALRWVFLDKTPPMEIDELLSAPL